MAEIQSSSWAETAASNNATVPDGWPEGQLPATVNDCAREMMAAIKRDWNRSHVTISSTGSANAYVLTYANAPTLTHGMIFSFKANFTNTGAATVNINALGAVAIVKNDGSTSLVANDIVANQHVHLEYDSALAKMVALTPLSTTATIGTNTFSGDQTITAGAINTARATVASAATTADIWAADGNQIDWTGTITCTGFPAAPQAGVSRTLICAGAAPFTAGANMLIAGVSSGSTMTCGANDKIIVEAITTTQFHLERVKYVKPDGPTVQIFTSSGTYTKPAGLVVAIVEVCGGGGGGGGSTNASATAGGGGGGASTRTRLLASAIGATETVTIGAGGAGGNTAGSNGSAGGTSSLGVLATAAGGAGGSGATVATTPYLGGLGGASGTGDVLFNGEPGGTGLNAAAGNGFSGNGGGSTMGGGGRGVVSGGLSGNAGVQHGGGGSGAFGSGAGGTVGGAGFAGVIIVTEYY